jgi:hypothetical protein
MNAYETQIHRVSVAVLDWKKRHPGSVPVFRWNLPKGTAVAMTARKAEIHGYLDMNPEARELLAFMERIGPEPAPTAIMVRVALDIAKKETR